MNIESCVTNFGSYKKGLNFVASKPKVKSLILIKALYCLGGPTTMILALFGQQVFTIGETAALGISLLYFARGLGAFIGPIAFKAFSEKSISRKWLLMMASFPLFSLAYISLGLVTNPWLAFFAIVCAHCFATGAWLLSTVLLQLEVPTEVRGRVFGLELGLFTLTLSISTLIIGFLVEGGYLSIQRCTMLMAFVWMVGLMLWVVMSRKSLKKVLL